MTRLTHSPFRVNAALLLAMAALFLLPVHGDDWPVYRGPDRNGISSEAGMRTSGKAEEAWAVDLGLGFGSPVVSGGKVVVSGHDGDATDTLWCLDEKTGEVVWKFSYPQPLGDLYYQGGTTGTATFDGDRIYHGARQGELFCLSAKDGSVIWKKHLQEDLGYKMPDWGFTGAPLVVGDRLYVTAGESGLALNKADGSVAWQSEDEKCGYSTPVAFEKGGKDYLLFSNHRYYVCVSAETGEPAWEWRWMTRYGVNSADPIVSGGHILISSGYGKGAVLLKWDGSGEPEEVWKSRELRTQMNAAVLIDGHLYGIDGDQAQDGTSLKCLDFLTGEPKWSDTSVAHGTLSAVGDQLLVLTEDGELRVGKASPEGFQPTITQKVLEEYIWTVPVFANGRVYCRNAAGRFVALSLGKDS